jgi:hypothetical protein
MSNNAPGMFVEGAEAFRIFAYISNEDYQGLMQYLRFQKAPLDLMNMHDQRNFSVLTYAAYRDQTNCFKILFEYAWKHQFHFNQEVKESKVDMF